MKPIKDYFKNARVGDRVEHVDGDIGVIKSIVEGPYPIGVLFDNYPICFFNLEGATIGGYNHQALFYEGIKIILPPEPKRKVKKTYWVNTYKPYDDGAPFYFGRTAYDCKEDAQMYCDGGNYLGAFPIDVETEE